MSSQSMESPTIVILGAGIVGLSTAFYLSQPPSPTKEEDGSRTEVNSASIHIFDPTSSLFSSASGKAAGFLASDWFSSRPMLALGALSLTEHRLLAEAHRGRERWGYVSGMAIGYTPDDVEMDEGNGDDWLWEGGSRSGVAPSAEGEKEGYRPIWLKPGKTEDLSAVDGTAQVNPRELCQFLLETCKSRGVQIHQPARVEKVLNNGSKITGVEYVSLDSSNTQSAPGENGKEKAKIILPCTHILLAAGAWTPQVFTSLFPSHTPQPIKVPIYPLAGWSITIPLPPLPAGVSLPTSSDAVFASSSGAPKKNEEAKEEGYTFAPEFFSRPRTETVPSSTAATSASTGEVAPKWHIWLGGLNSSTHPLPHAEYPAPEPGMDDPHIRDLVDVAGKFFVYDADTEGPEAVDGLEGAADAQSKSEADAKESSTTSTTAVYSASKELSTVTHTTNPTPLSTALCFRPATRTGRPIMGKIPQGMYLPPSNPPPPTNSLKPDPSFRNEDNETIGGLYISSGHGPWGIALSLGSGKVMSEIMLRGDRKGVWKDLGLEMA